MRVYLDESGCTGFNFGKPYLNGGSSRFLCLAFLFVPAVYDGVPNSIIAGLYKKYGWKNEKKASTASWRQKLEFADLLLQMNKDAPGIVVDCIIVKKEKILPHIAEDPNKIYNYMCKLVMVERVKKLTEFEFIPDKRTVKLKSGKGLESYLQTTLWFDCGVTTKLIHNPQESHKNYAIQFVDWVAHIVWAAHERDQKEAFERLYPGIHLRRLFFQ
jgi:hypothetical protein